MKVCVKKIREEKMEEYEIWKNKIKVILKLYKSFYAMLYIYIFILKKLIFFKNIPLFQLVVLVMRYWMSIRLLNSKTTRSMTNSSLKNKLDMLSWHPASVKPMLEKVKVGALEVVESCHCLCYHYPWLSSAYRLQVSHGEVENYL